MQSFATFMASVPASLVPRIESAVTRAVELLADPSASAAQVEALGRELAAMPAAVEKGALAAVRGEIRERLAARLGAGAAQLEPRLGDILSAAEKVRTGLSVWAKAGIAVAVAYGLTAVGMAANLLRTAKVEPATHTQEAVQALESHMRWRESGSELGERSRQMQQAIERHAAPVRAAAPRAMPAVAARALLAAPQARAAEPRPMARAAERPPERSEPMPEYGRAQVEQAPVQQAPPVYESQSHLGNRSIEVRSEVGTFRGSGF